MRRPRSTWGLAACLFGVACTSSPPEGTSVAVSLFPIYDLARRIAGDRLSLDLMLPPGMFDHNFEPRPRDFAKMSRARFVVLVGLGLDRWGQKLASGADNAEILELAPLLDPLAFSNIAVEVPGHPHVEQGGPGALDAHVWLDPARMRTAVDTLVERYCRLDPQGAQGFHARGAGVKASLAALDQEISEKAHRFRKRSIVTFHGSWNYFAARYGLTIAAVVEPFPGQEPTPTYVRDVLKIIQEKDVAALFSEPQLNRRPGEVIAQEARIPLFELDPIGGTPGVESYEALLRHDTDVLAQALK